jgi:hypothetical protein
MLKINSALQSTHLSSQVGVFVESTSFLSKTKISISDNCDDGGGGSDDDNDNSHFIINTSSINLLTAKGYS